MRNGQIIADPAASVRYWLACAVEPMEALFEQIALKLRSRILANSLLALPLLVSANMARAQTISPLVPVSLDPDYNRGRNLSVKETIDPIYQPLGVRLGSILAYPSVALTTGATDNVYVANNFKRSDAYHLLQPAVRVVTDLPMHEVELIGSLNVSRYSNEKLRNQETYFLSGQGRLDLGPDLQVTGQVQHSRIAESPFAADVASDVSVLSEYTASNQALSAVYKTGRMRLTGKAQHLSYKFNEIVFADGSSRDQRDRNRKVVRGTGQVEFAISPSVAAFTQVNVEVTDFAAAAFGAGAARDSKTVSALLGWNFDLSGFARGSVAAGYLTRHYSSTQYEDQGGLVLQARADVFVSPLTTVSAGAQRTIQDAATSRNGSYVDTRANISLDHGLLRNLILSGEATVVRSKLLETGGSSKRSLYTVGARYQSNRSISVEGDVQYSKGRPGSIAMGTPFNELRGQLTLRFRR